MRKLYLFFILLFIFFGAISSALGQINYNIDVYDGQTITDPNGYFYDDGGEARNYTNNKEYTMTFQASPGKIIIVAFEEFDIEAYNNGWKGWLSIYNSKDRNATFLINDFENSNPISNGQVFTSANDDNALYFWFGSYAKGKNNNFSGWKANVKTVDPHHFYSYQSGDWDVKETWTLDPSGTVFVDGGVPGAGDQVTILNGRDVSVLTSYKDITAVEIEKGGSLDLGTTIGHTFGDITGQGLLRLATADFPTITTDAFLQADGGTVEYYFSGDETLETGVTKYNNLIFNLANSTSIARISRDLIINGNITINNGYFRIDRNNNVTINIISDLLINAGGVFDYENYHTGNNNYTWDSWRGWIYVDNFNVHTINIKGNFTNNGQALFFNRTVPDYLGTREEDRCQVIFNNPIKNQSVQMNGLTRFYRIEIDKGADDTYILNLDASATANFQLLGRNNYTFNSSPGAGNFANNNSLGLLGGTVRIGTNVSIPCLSSTTSGTYWIDSDAKLWLDGGTVIVSDNTLYNFDAVVVYGKIFVSNNGIFRDISNEGIVMRETAVLQIDNGTFEAYVIRTSSWTDAVHRGTFIMNGGDLLLHGNTQDSGLGYHASFSLPYPDNVFIMTGGNITIELPTSAAGAARGFSLMLNPNLGNSSIIGGTINITVPATRNAVINTNMKLWNLNISGSNTRSLILERYEGNVSPPIPAQPAQDLVVQNNLTVTTTTLDANNQNVTVGKDFNLNGTYTPGNNTTTFNGSQIQQFDNNGTITDGLYNFKVTNSSKTTINNNITVRGDLTIDANCSFDDFAKTISVNGNLDISGAHISRSTGNIQLRGSLNQTITGNGFGVLGNLYVNKNIGTTKLDTDININGNLRLIGSSSSINLTDRSLKFSETSKIYSAITGTETTFSSSKMLFTNGNSSDGGITFDHFTNTSTRLFPLGVAGKYTPTNITVGSASITPGTITVRPVNRKVSLAQSNNILNYFWKINTADLAGILPSSINIDCKYIDSDITTGNKDNYVPGFFQNSKWVFSSNRLDIDRPNTTIYYKNISEIDGLYTAGEPDAFTEIFTYYSRQDGDWNNLNTWSTDPVLKWDGDPALTVPNGSAPVVIGNGSTINHHVTISRDNQTAALLHVNSGSVLDIGTSVGHSFWSVTSSTGVDKGRVRIGSSFFPGGDWGEFLGANGGTVEYYNLTDNRYTIPNNNYPSTVKNEYYNLVINTNQTTNKQIDFVGADLLIHNDLTKEGQQVSLFNTTGFTIDVEGNLFVKEGKLRYRTGGNTLIVRKDITVDNGATFDINSGSNHKLISYGNIINNGIFDLNSNGTVSAIFKGAQDVVVSGNGSRTDFYSIEVDKGTSKVSIVDVTSTNFALSDNHITLVNGTFRLSSAVNITLDRITPFDIPATAALSANGGTINVGNDDDDSDIILQGTVEVLKGAINVGPATSGSNNDIIIAATGKPEVIVSDGTLNVQGQIRRPSSVAMGSLNYIQTGGTVNIYGKNDIGDITNRADLEILNSGSKFDMSAGRIIIHQPGNTTFGDLYLSPETSNVTGGEIQLGSNSLLTDTRRNFNVFVGCDIYDLRISGSKTFSATLNTFPLTLHSLMIDMNSVFNANGIDVNISGNLENNNDDNGVGLNRGGYRVQTSNQTTRFFGSGNKEIKSTENNSTNFANLVIDNSGGVRTFVTRDICVNTDLIINSGILSNNTSAKTRLFGNVYNKSTHESSNGGYIEFEGLTEQTIDGNDFGVFGSIKLSNDKNVKALNDFTVNGDINFSQGSLVIDEYQLTLGSTATITGTTDVDHMIVTNGALRDMGISKLFLGNETFTYPFGVAGKYTPATITATGVTSGGAIRVRPINFAHKSSDANSDNQLNYYWSVYKQGLTGASFSKIFTFDPSDVKGTIGNYKGAFYENYKWTRLNPFGVNASANTITFPSNTILEAEYTAAEDANFVDKPILYSRTTTGDWDNPNTWSYTGHGGISAGVIPDGNPVKIASGHTINVRNNGCYSYSVDVTDGGIIDFGNTNLHDIGFVSGGGKIRIKSTSSGYFVFPGGDFSVFMSTPGSTIEYYGSGTLPETRFYQNVIFASNPYESNIIKLANNGFTVNGNITIQDRTTLENGNFSKRIIAKNNWITNGTGAFSPGFGEVYFDGAVSQNIIVNSSQSFYDLIINNSNGVTITGNHITVLNNLSLTDGIVKTSSSSILKLANVSPNSIIGGSSTSYVDGPLQKNISPGGYFFFPIGNNARYANTLIFNSTNSVNEYWQAEYFNNNPDNAVPPMNHLSVKAPIEIVSNNEYWQIKSTNAASKAGIRLRWDNLSGVIPTVASERINKMRIAKWETSEWIAAGDRVLDGGVNSGSVESNSDLSTGFYSLAVESRPTAVINTANIELCNDGSNAEIEILLTGVAPYNFTYTINGGNSKNVTGINTQPYKLFIAADDLYSINGNDDYVIKISDVWDATGSHGVSDFNKSVTVKINETPTPKVEGKTASNFNLAGDIYHSGTVTVPDHTYSWTINGGVITSSSTGSHQITVKWGPVGTTNAWIELTETSASGCSTISRLNVSLSEMPTPNVSGMNAVCIGDVEKYTTAAAVGHSFVWTVTGGSFTGQGTNEIEVTWNSAGSNRKVRVDETVGINTAFSELNVDVFILPLDNYTITYDAIVVESTTAQVTVNGLPMGLNIQVFDANDNSSVSAVVPSNAGGDIVVDYNPTRTGQYYIVLTNGNGCKITLTSKINITLIPPFTPVITENNAHHCGGHSDSFSATANDDYNYKWTILNCTITDDTTNTVDVTWNNPTSPTTITVTVKLVVTHKVSGKTVEVTKDVTVIRTPETGEQYHLINNFS